MKNPNVENCQKIESQHAPPMRQNDSSNFNQQHDDDSANPHPHKLIADNAEDTLLSKGDDETPPSYYKVIFQDMQTLSKVVVPPITQQPMSCWVKFDRFPLQDILCKNCNRVCTTMVQESYQSAAYAWCWVLFCFAGLLCAVVPFMCQDLKKTEHTCPHCRTKIGIYAPKMTFRTLTELTVTLLVGLGTSLFVVLMLLYGR